MNNKGQANSFLPYILFGMVVVFIFSIVVVPVAFLGDNIFDALKQNNTLGKYDSVVSTVSQVQNLMTPAFDQLVFVILIAIILGTFVIAIFTDYHPVILGIMILAIVLLVIVGYLFSNVYEQVTETSILQEKATEFTFTNLIMGEQLPIIIMMVGVISIIILLSKRGRITPV